MRRHRVSRGLAVLSVAILAAVSLSAGTGQAATKPAPAAPVVQNCQGAIDRTFPWTGMQPIAVNVRAGAHETGPVAKRYDRVVVDLTEQPSFHIGYVPKLLGDASGLPVAINGSAYLDLRLKAVSHNSQGHGTMLVRNIKVNWGSLQEVKVVSDYEGVVQVGVGLRQRVDFLFTLLINPDRVVIDVAMPGQHPWVPFCR